MTIAVVLRGPPCVRGSNGPRVAGGFGRKPAPGPGYLAGEFPDGITSVLGAPEPATIRVLYRPTGVLVAEVQSAANGTWQVDNLNPALKFDVVCRKEGYNDLIWADVIPTEYPYVLGLSGGFSTDSSSFGLAGSVTILPGTGVGPYSLQVSGNPPPGIFFTLSGLTITASGKCREPGDYSWSFRVTDGHFKVATLDCSVTGIAAADPYIKFVRTLLHFDGTNGSSTVVDNGILNTTWTANSGFSLSNTWAAAGPTSGKFTGVAPEISTPYAAGLSFAGDFTVEVTIRPDTPATGTIQQLVDFWDSTGIYLSITTDGKLNGGVQTPDGVFTIADTVALATATPVHVALVRKANTLYLFKGGALVGSMAVTGDGSTGLSGVNFIGRDSSGSRPYAGYMDELRITPAARYTAPFTPPAVPYPNPF